jgi:hypothetical protein
MQILSFLLGLKLLITELGVNRRIVGLLSRPHINDEIIAIIFD